ncbi:hypothetical protein TNCT_370591 [Trichonephila clavata]|uniref:Pre-C2HC domain-containing protein n=1 Tax=Trichonephila clavata TaxID=2740835 RepID=A0A8X6EZB4_TRICU|nr:hypothetical protein TNCT_370591 [Trichonephila clavata]
MNGEEFYEIPPPSERPYKVVLKGLPASTDIDEIKNDLANQRVAVSKVAQLTQRKSKSPLPMFLVEVRKNVPDSRDILDVSNCCYIEENKMEVVDSDPNQVRHLGFVPPQTGSNAVLQLQLIPPQFAISKLGV